MNLPSSPPALTAPIEHWSEWSNGLSNEDLTKVHRAIACWPDGHSSTYRAKLKEIDGLVKDVMVSRFASVVAQATFAENELRKAKALSRPVFEDRYRSFAERE